MILLCVILILNKKSKEKIDLSILNSLKKINYFKSTIRNKF